MSVVRSNPDGTLYRVNPALESLQRFEPAKVAQQVSRYVDDLTALQLGLAKILSPLQFVSLDRKAYHDSGKIEVRVFEFDAIMFDFADTEDSFAKHPVAALIQGSDSQMDLPGPLSPGAIIEDSLDEYGEGTVLRRLFDNSVLLTVMSILTNKDDRAALRKGLLSAFAGDPHSEGSGRRIVIPEYFGQTARYDLVGVDYIDTSDTVHQKKFPLVARIQGDITVVDLVSAPALMRPDFSIEASVGPFASP